MPIHCSNAAEIAKRLEAHDLIEVVHHPSLSSHRDRELAKRIIPKGTGMIAFTVKSGDEAALKFCRELR